MTHTLKCDVKFFTAIWNNLKNFEYRFNDRDFKDGDTLIIKEFDKSTYHFTGRILSANISYLLSKDNGFESLGDYVILSLSDLKIENI